MQQNDNVDVSASIGGQSLKMTGAGVNNLVTILSFCMICVLSFAQWQHLTDSKDNSRLLILAINALTNAQVEATRIARVQNCLLAVPPDQRRNIDCGNISR